MQVISLNAQGDEVLFETSPTDVDIYELCPRKWAFAWINGLRPPKHPSALKGIKVHKHLELWLKKRVPPGGNEEARVAQVMLPHLPPPHLVDPGNVELNAGIVLGGVRFAIAIDLFMPELEPLPVVYDHKSTSSFDWCLSPDTMDQDIQATLYAAWAMVTSRRDRVAVQWTYGRTKGAPLAHPVRAELGAGQITGRLERTVRSAREMQLILEQVPRGRALDVVHDPGACDAYGGCPFQELCNLTPEERLRAIMSQGTVRENYLERLRSRKQNGAGASPGQVNPDPVPPQQPAQQAQAAPPPAQQATPPAAPAAPAGGNRLTARLAAKKAGQAQAAPQSAAEAQQPAAQQAPAAQPQQPAAAQAEAQPAQEAPRAPRGRPRKDAAPETSPPPQPSEQWLLIVAAASKSMLAKFEPEELIDAEALETIATAAGTYADRVMLEYVQRFGG